MVSLKLLKEWVVWVHLVPVRRRRRKRRGCHAKLCKRASTIEKWWRGNVIPKVGNAAFSPMVSWRTKVLGLGEFWGCLTRVSSPVNVGRLRRGVGFRLLLRWTGRKHDWFCTIPDNFGFGWETCVTFILQQLGLCRVLHSPTHNLTHFPVKCRCVYTHVRHRRLSCGHILRAGKAMD